MLQNHEKHVAHVQSTALRYDNSLKCCPIRLYQKMVVSQKKESRQ